MVLAGLLIAYIGMMDTHYVWCQTHSFWSTGIKFFNSLMMVGVAVNMVYLMTSARIVGGELESLPRQSPPLESQSHEPSQLP